MFGGEVFAPQHASVKAGLTMLQENNWVGLPRVLQGRYLVRRMTPNDMHQLLDIRRQVLDELAHPDLYVRENNEVEFVLEHCGQRGETIGLFEKHGEQAARLIAYAMVGFPGRHDADNLGITVGLPEAQLDKVGILASCMVLPSHRGHGLQQQLLLLRQLLCVSHGRTHCLAMISLHNRPCRFNLFRAGMLIRWVGVLAHYGLQRQVVYCDQNNPTIFDESHIRLVDELDFDTQSALAAEGWWGVREKLGKKKEPLIEFARQIETK